jgi:hypothetical protein
VNLFTVGQPHRLSHDGAYRWKVGATGFEPATSCSRSRRATGLRYAPNKTANERSSARKSKLTAYLRGTNTRPARGSTTI